MQKARCLLFMVKATVAGATSGTNYLKIDIFKEGSSLYFGETFNGLNWYNGSDGKQYVPISITSGVDWSGIIQGKIGTPSVVEYDGIGTYKLRVRRYTASGNLANDGDNSVAIQIMYPTQTPTPTLLPTLTDMPTPIKVPTPTKISTPESTATLIPTAKNSQENIVMTSIPLRIPTKVLGNSTQSALLVLSTPTPRTQPTPTVKVQEISKKQDHVPYVFIGGGFLLLFAYGILIFQPKLYTLWKKE